MDFTYDDEQIALRESVAALLSRAYGGGERRDVVAQEPGFSTTTWRQLADMGVLGLPFATQDGGMGAGPVEVSLVAQQIGRAVAPEPFVEVVVLAGGLVAAVGTAAQRERILGALTDGQTLPVFAHAEPGTRWSDAAKAVRAVPAGGGWRLHGVKEPVLHGARADLLVVSAVVDGTPRLFVVDGEAAGLTRTGYRTFDGGRAAKVSFDDTPADLLGDDSAADRTGEIAAALARARIAYCHEAVGAMQSALNTTTGYLTTRRQFGRTLNTFQALTFRAADMYVSLELATSITLWATMVQEAGGDVVMAAERARLQTSRAGRHIGKEAIQLHGGIGMTSEYSIGHYTTRLTAIDHVLGDGDWALNRLAARLGDHDTLDALGQGM